MYILFYKLTMDPPKKLTTPDYNNMFWLNLQLAQIYVQTLFQFPANHLCSLISEKQRITYYYHHFIIFRKNNHQCIFMKNHNRCVTMKRRMRVWIAKLRCYEHRKNSTDLFATLHALCTLKTTLNTRRIK